MSIINHYLHITYIGNKIEVSSNDGVFNSIATLDKTKYNNYCDEKEKEFLYSNLGNFKKYEKEDRILIAEKWSKAKELPEGKYDYYFNLNSTNELFEQEVKNLANKLNISNYKLIIN